MPSRLLPFLRAGFSTVAALTTLTTLTPAARAQSLPAAAPPALLAAVTYAPQLAAAAKSYRVYYAKVNPKDASSYLMDHSSFIYLIGPDGSFRALYRHGISAAELADALKIRLSTGT